MPRQVESIVECHAGYSTCDHPKAILKNGQRLAVTNIEREWREPSAKVFQVQTSNCRRFQIRYDDTTYQWKITCIG